MDVISQYLVNNLSKVDTKPLVSVIMPVYNRENIVKQAIDSVLCQSYQNIELIILKIRDIICELIMQKGKKLIIMNLL